MDLSRAVPALRKHPLLRGKSIPLVGVSTIARDETGIYFEIGKPKYWRAQEDGTTIVGIGGIGGTIEQGETPLACLRREVAEELGARVRLQASPQTYVLHEWQIADQTAITASRKHLPPLMVILSPPRLGGPGMPDHLAIVAYRTFLRGKPAPGDLFGLLRIEDSAVREFLEPDQTPLEQARQQPGVTITLNGELPDGAILRPVLTARAFQVLIRAGCPDLLGSGD